LKVSASKSATSPSCETLAGTTKRHRTQKKVSKLLHSAMNKTSTIFKHIAKGRNANYTFAKSLKSSFFSFACDT
jgi:hypothetical protein